MGRTTALVVMVGAVGGFAAGWLISGSRPPAPVEAHGPAPSRALHTQTPSPVGVDQEFALRPEDVQADREHPAIAVDAKGRIVLAWASQSGADERTLYLARSNNGGHTFETPVPWRKVPIYRYAAKGKGKSVTYSTHVLPRLATVGDAHYLAWVEALDGGPNVAFFVARSSDGGRTFSDALRTHSGEAVKPGFTTMVAGPDGSLLCAWLDGRNKAPQPFASRRPRDSEGFEPDQMVFSGPDGKGVCPCCDVAVAGSPDGSRFVAFRNNDAGTRDIWMARAEATAGAFGLPAPVSRARWKFDGCPHDGPELLVASDQIHVAWMDASSGKDRVYYATSPLSALRFRPVEINAHASGAQGHPKLAADRAGTVHAVWDESLRDDPAPAHATSEHGHGHGAPLTGGGRAIVYAVARDGTFGPATAIALRHGAYQLHPAIAIGPDGAVYVAWSELDGEGKRVRFTRLKADAGPASVGDARASQ